MAEYAVPLFRRRHDQFDHVLLCLQQGYITATDAVHEVVYTIKECVGKATHLARQDKGGSSQHRNKVGPGQAPWFDSECQAVRARFEQAWLRFRNAEKEYGSAADREPLLANIKSDFLACRYEWQRCKRRKIHQHEQEIEKGLIRKFFSSQPRDFWKVFNRSDLNECKLDDIDGCTAYFKSLLGVQVTDPDPDSLRGSWVPASDTTGVLDSEDCAYLNKDLTREELSGTIMACKNGKAGDPDGMTAEALKLCVVCKADSLLDCIVAVLDNCHQQVPEQLKLNKLTPVPKCSSSGKDNSLHRGIAVGSFFAKLGEKYRYTRLSELSERKHLRCPTQCGFRPEHGTLDAIFTLQHVIDKARHSGECMVSCLVDFEKAFDRVDRVLMLRRCKELGIEGKFLEALHALYDEIKMVVSLHGDMGQPFDTFQGTRQGSELSPLLFGFFIEQLHYLLQEKIPGTGPIIGKLQVPDLMYADDVILMAINSHAQMQGLLDALHLFCRLFGMRVNIKKTKIILFTPMGQALSRELAGKVWLYDGLPVNIVEEEKYLGMIFNGHEGPLHAASKRAKAGSGAMHGMLAKCLETRLSRPDIVCSLFDKLVVPVLSYGCQVWGPYMASRWIKDPLNKQNDPEKVHCDFLRQVSGMPKFAHKASLYKEMGREPLMLQWLILSARMWNSMCARDSGAIMYMAFADNLELMLKKCRSCWSYHFLKAMHTIGVLKHQVWNYSLDSIEAVMELHFEEANVREAAMAFFDRHWEICTDEVDPRQAPSNKVTCSTYLQWVGIPGHRGGARHMRCCMPRQLRKDLMAIKLGCHQLNIQALRMGKTKTPRHDRLCPLCQEPGMVEDLQHFMLDCGFYSGIRAKHKNIFDALRARGLAPAQLMRTIFDHDHQLDLACCIQEMLSLRRATMQQPCYPGDQKQQQQQQPQPHRNVTASDGDDWWHEQYWYDTFEEGDDKLRVWTGRFPIDYEEAQSDVEAYVDGEFDEESGSELEQLSVISSGLDHDNGLPPGFSEG